MIGNISSSLIEHDYSVFLETKPHSPLLVNRAHGFVSWNALCTTIHFDIPQSHGHKRISDYKATPPPPFEPCLTSTFSVTLWETTFGYKHTP